VVVASLRSVVTIVALFTAYYVVPVDDLGREGALLRIVAGCAVIVGIVVFELRRIIDATYPMLRTVEGVSVVLPLILIVFAGSYLVLADADSDAFSEPLDHTASLYFTVTTATTVGFGDITPVTDTARVAVMLQMVSNVFLLGVAIRLMLQGVKVNQMNKAAQRTGAP